MRTTVLAAPLLGAAMLVANVASAEALPGNIDHHEYVHLSKWATRADVEHTVHAYGKTWVSWYGGNGYYAVRKYATPTPGKFVYITYVERHAWGQLHLWRAQYGN